MHNHTSNILPLHEFRGYISDLKYMITYLLSKTIAQHAMMTTPSFLETTNFVTFTVSTCNKSLSSTGDFCGDVQLGSKRMENLHSYSLAFTIIQA